MVHENIYVCHFFKEMQPVGPCGIRNETPEQSFFLSGLGYDSVVRRAGFARRKYAADRTLASNLEHMLANRANALGPGPTEQRISAQAPYSMAGTHAVSRAHAFSGLDPCLHGESFSFLQPCD